MDWTGWTIEAVELGLLPDIPVEHIYYQDTSGRTQNMPLIMYVLRSAGRTVIVDTGGPADEEVILRMTPFGYEVPEANRIHNALDRIGVNPADVDLVINTHLHWDHCSNNNVFENAEIILQEKELAYAHEPCAAHLPAYGFYEDNPPIFSLAEDRIRTVDGVAELAPGLGVVPLPGHSPGSQGVRVDTAAGTFVITGDCVDTYRNFDESLPSGRFSDLYAYKASLKFLRESGWTPLPSHDPKVLEKGRFGV
ncbi:N-acyl homoserine lactonase family protein [Rhodococcoides fascians]|uniref:N-acyl homoserine lactonase family protein n=1 Tax=Rhodococcoides fascians TaxID=1828 RepID=UPI00378DC3F1